MEEVSLFWASRDATDFRGHLVYPRQIPKDGEWYSPACASPCCCRFFLSDARTPHKWRAGWAHLCRLRRRNASRSDTATLAHQNKAAVPNARIHDNGHTHSVIRHALFSIPLFYFSIPDVILRCQTHCQTHFWQWWSLWFEVEALKVFLVFWQMENQINCFTQET